MAETPGSVEGKVEDNKGTGLPGVTLQLTGGLEPVTRISNAEGKYGFHLLKPNDYKLTAALEGFNTAVVQGIVVRPSSTTTVDIQMTLANLEESV